MKSEKKVIKNFFDDTSINKKHLFMIIIIAVAFVFEQADNFNFTYVAPALRDYWGLTVQDVGYINTLFAIGMLLGSFIFGAISDRWGRKKTLMLAACFFSTFSLLNGLATSPIMFALMRFLTGIGICGVIVVAPTYLVEILPCKNRGRLFGITLGCGYIGIPIIAVICNILIPMGNDHWRYVYILGCTGYLIALLSIKGLKESPRWLVSKGRVEEAEKIVEGIVGPEYKCDFSDVVVKNEKFSVREMLKVVFSKRHIRDTVALLSSNGIILPGGLIFVNNSAMILLDRGFSMEQSLQIASIMSVGMFGGPIAAAVIGDFGGRKWPLAISAGLLAAVTLVYGLSQQYGLLLVLGFVASMLIQIGTVVTSNYGPELYPTKYRNAATGLVGTLGRICAIIMMGIFPTMYTFWGPTGVYIFLAIAFSVTALTVGILGRRTAGVCLEDVSEN